MLQTQAADPVVIPAGEGEAFSMLDSRYAVLAGAAETGGRATFVECTAPPTGAGDPPMHRHVTEDEAFLVLDGALEIHVPEQDVVRRLEPGDFALVPAGVEHTFRVASAGPARWLVVTTGCDFERFVRAVGRPMEGPGLPESTPPPPPDVLVAVAAEHGVVVTGPPVR